MSSPDGFAYGHHGRIFDLAFHPRRAWLASASEDGTARVWRRAASEPVAWQQVSWCWAATGACWCIPCADRTRSASARPLRTAAAQVRCCTGHAAEALRVAWSPSGSVLASGKWPRLRAVPSAEGGCTPWLPTGHRRLPAALRLQPPPARPAPSRPSGGLLLLLAAAALVAGGADGVVKLWRLGDEQRYAGAALLTLAVANACPHLWCAARLPSSCRAPGSHSLPARCRSRLAWPPHPVTPAAELMADLQGHPGEAYALEFLGAPACDPPHQQPACDPPHQQPACSEATPAHDCGAAALVVATDDMLFLWDLEQQQLLQRAAPPEQAAAAAGAQPGLAPGADWRHALPSHSALGRGPRNEVKCLTTGLGCGPTRLASTGAHSPPLRAPAGTRHDGGSSRGVCVVQGTHSRPSFSGWTISQRQQAAPEAAAASWQPHAVMERCVCGRRAAPAACSMWPAHWCVLTCRVPVGSRWCLWPASSPPAHTPGGGRLATCPCLQVHKAGFGTAACFSRTRPNTVACLSREGELVLLDTRRCVTCGTRCRHASACPICGCAQAPAAPVGCGCTQLLPPGWAMQAGVCTGLHPGGGARVQRALPALGGLCGRRGAGGCGC